MRSVRACYEIAIISSSWPDASTTSPTALPIRDLATGDTKEIEPTLGSASSLPRYDILYALAVGAFNPSLPGILALPGNF